MDDREGSGFAEREWSAAGVTVRAVGDEFSGLVLVVTEHPPPRTAVEGVLALVD